MGGGEIVFFNIAKDMSKRGHVVHVVCHKLINFVEPDIPGITVHRINPKVKHKNELPVTISDNLAYAFNAVLKGSSLIREKKIDIIHSNSFTSVLAGTVLSRIHNIPLVCTIHDVFSTNSSDNWKRWASQNKLSWFSSKLGPIFEKLTLMVHKDLIHTISLSTMDDLKSLGVRTPIRVIPNGLDLDEFTLGSLVNDYDDYVVFIGRLVFYKNVDVLIRAFSYVVRSLPHAKLFIVGDGPMRSSWEQLSAKLNLESTVIFLGFISHDDKIKLLAKSSALLMPSSFEGFGLVLLEAFAMKKPVVVPNIRPYDEIVDDKIDGYILPANDPFTWSEKIVELLSNKDLCRDLGSNGRRKVQEKYDNNYLIGELENLYFAALNHTVV